MAVPDREAGDVLGGRYRLLERLGQGGFGDVWRAEELLPDGKPLRDVALKLLVHAVASDWAEEARIIASLRHPALVTIYAAGLVDVGGNALPFVAMELLRGENLARVVEGGQRVAWRRALGWAREAAAALDEIHRAGVVHLDLKPANLFRTASGIKVLDFGISQKGAARDLPTLSGDDSLSTAAFIALDGPNGPSIHRTNTGTSRTVVGTPGFMAPEVIEGGEATPAADAYALAACLVLFATGRLPQDVRTNPGQVAATDQQSFIAEVQAATVHGRLREVDERLVPRGLRDLLARWLRLDPVGRGVEAGSLSAALDEVWERPFGAAPIPFRGLEPFGPEDEGNVHGRDREIERLGRELAEQPCLVLHGPAGAGLTSVALAGVVPALGKSGADGRDDWVACHLARDEAPGRALAEVLDAWSMAHAEGAESPPGENASWMDRLAAWARSSPLGCVVVVEDLEGLIRCRDDAARDLTTLLVRGTPGLRLLGLLREDRLPALLAEEFGRALQPHVRYLSAPSGSAAEELVRDPARVAGRPLEAVDDVIDEIKAELRREGGSIATVNLALARWWEGPLSSARWREQGGLTGPLAEHAERTFVSLTPEQRVTAEAMLLRMLRADGRMLAIEPEALFESAHDATMAARTLDALASARLVTRVAGGVTLAHAALATRWARLQELRLRNVEQMTCAEELRSAARRWRQAGSPPRDVWSGVKLADFDARFGVATRGLGSDERAFLDASRAARKRGRLLQGALVVALCALVFAAFAFESVRRAHAAAKQAELDRANHEASVERLVTSSRRTADPYRRIALLGAALDAGSDDPILPFELFAATRDLPPARFLTLDPPQAPRFAWDARLLLGHTREHVVLLDLLPEEGADWGAVETRFAAHDEGIHDVVPLRFGHGFVTRGLDGTLRVFRVRENREVALAAESPMRCVRGLSQVLVADAAPVLACVTTDGIARWDLRGQGAAETLPFVGRLLAIGPDGRFIAVARQDRLVTWEQGHTPVETVLPDRRTPLLAAFAPNGRALAVVDGRGSFFYALESGDLALRFGGSALAHGISEPVEARFSESGIDFAVCSGDGRGSWTYLRRGGRAAEDGVAPDVATACRSDVHAPEPLRSIEDYGALALDAVTLGPRKFEGGFKLADGRLITRDLVAFDPKDHALDAVTHLGDETTGLGGAAVGGVTRLKDSVVWQVGSDVRSVSLNGDVSWTRKGQLLTRCPDDRVLIWRKASETRWEIADARADAIVATVVREPGFILGVEPSCRRLFVQAANGRVAAASLTGPTSAIVAPTPIDPGGGGYAVDGYVYDVRRSAGWPGEEPGLWLAFSSGALARANASGTLKSYGHAAPRATAMADGPRLGELIFADEAGVVRRMSGEQDRRLVGPMPDRLWSDLHVLPDGRRALLAWASGFALVDLERGDMLGWLDHEGRDRLAPWDDEGSVLAWSFAWSGPATADVLPFGRALGREVARRASNLSASLDASGKPHLTLR